MKSLFTATTAAIFMTAFAAPSFAAKDDEYFDDLHEDSNLGFVGEIDLEYGGEAVDTVLFTNGSTQDVKSGQGITAAVGMHYRPANWDVDFSGTVGYKFVTTAASNANIGITRGVVQLLVTYDPKDSWWVSGGLVQHIGTKFNADGFGSDRDFGNSLGATLQGGWKWIGLTYTYMKYKQQSSPGAGTQFDASVVGLTVRWKS
jgi:hypothetical protein